MFTGIVNGLGRIVTMEPLRGGARIVIAAPSGYGPFRRGESVCVSGVCLTAVSPGRRLVTDLSAETLRRSTLRNLERGDAVNLERALAWGDRLSGHFVLGHVDAITRLVGIRASGNSWLYRFAIPSGFSRFVVTKGSVAIDGISLTVARRRSRAFDIAIIPETRRRTTLSAVRAGSRLNFEVDLFARYGVSGWRRRVEAVAAGSR